MEDSNLITWTVRLGLLTAVAVAVLSVVSAAAVMALEPAAPAPGTTTWDVGPGLTAMVIAVVTAIGTTVTVLVNSILAAKGRAENAAKLTEVKNTGEETHKIVNSQRTEMTAELKRQSVEMNSLKDQIRELTMSRDIAREANPKKPDA